MEAVRTAVVNTLTGNPGFPLKHLLNTVRQSFGHEPSVTVAVVREMLREKKIVRQKGYFMLPDAADS